MQLITSVRPFDFISCNNGSTYYSFPDTGQPTTFPSRGTVIDRCSEIGLVVNTGVATTGNLSLEVSNSPDGAWDKSSDVWATYDRLYIGTSSSPVSTIPLTAATYTPIHLAGLPFTRIRWKFACTGSGLLVAEMTVKPLVAR